MSKNLVDGVRALLADSLKAGLGNGFAVFPTSTVDAVVKPTVTLELFSITRAPGAMRGAWQNTLNVNVIAPDGSSEADLADWTFSVLEVLETQSNVLWDTATRGTYLDSYASMAISITALTTRQADPEPAQVPQTRKNKK